MHKVQKMNITLVCVGTVKEKFLTDAIKEYTKRLAPFCRFKVCEVAECTLAKKFSNADILSALANEKAKILSHIPKNSYVIALCIEGKELTSEDLAKHIENTALNGKSAITFIIGSSYGIDEMLKNSADFCLSMSKFTFPHQLARVILIEQIYRSFQIISGTKYHK